MTEVFITQQNSEETNPLLTGVGVAYHIIDGSMKLAEIAIDEFGGNYEERTKHRQPVYVPQEQQVHEKEKPNRMAELEARNAQHLSAIRIELGFLSQTAPTSPQEPAFTNPLSSAATGISAVKVAPSE